jgi:5-(carboxyamino)imidazole ribonucleotide synthase
MTSLGLKTVVFAKSLDECACTIATQVILDKGNDNSVKKFLSSVDVVTFENEFFEIERFQKHKAVFFPTLKVMSICQNKLFQKQLYEKIKIPTSKFFVVKNPSLVTKTFLKNNFSKGAVIKRAFGGYDGRGNAFYKNGKLSGMDIGSVPKEAHLYIEEFVKFKSEISVIAARDSKGNVACYPVSKTFQKDGMCEWTVTPSGLSAKAEKKAFKISAKILASLKAVGVFGIEMFWLGGDKILVNEIAPRVHNTGHWTMDGSITSQFEQHLRAGVGLGLGSTAMISAEVCMHNINGRIKSNTKSLDIKKAFVSLMNHKAFARDEIHIHWYEKSGYTYKRKLGHINVAGKKGTTVKKAAQVRQAIKI